MDVSDWTAFAALLVASIAALFGALSWWQAKRSADSATTSIEISKTAADASRRSAAAAEAAENARQRAQDEAEGPEFQCIRDLEGFDENYIDVEITMLDGPDLRQVVISPIGRTPGISAPESKIPPASPGVAWNGFVVNEVRRVRVGLDETGGSDLVTLRIACTERGERDRQWTRSMRLADMPVKPLPPT